MIISLSKIVSDGNRCVSLLNYRPSKENDFPGKSRAYKVWQLKLIIARLIFKINRFCEARDM